MMPDKQDKDIWGKISDTAASAGKMVGDEYQRLRLSHDIWLLDRDLQRAYAQVGKLIHQKYEDIGSPVDDELMPIYDEIKQLRDSILSLENKRNAIRPPTTADEKKADTEKQAETAGGQQTYSARERQTDASGEPGHKAEMEFLDDNDIPFFCSECGMRVDIYSGKKPKHCIRCGNRLFTG